MEYTLKKQLGQHFLVHETICRQIVTAIEQQMAEHAIQNVVEVGPGGGAITKYLYQLPDINFTAVEFDVEKVQYLAKQYPELKDKIVQADFLQIPPPFESPFAVVGNFPYNISSQILFKVLDWLPQVPFCVGMFQKEVAERVAAKPGSKAFGIISVLLQAKYNISYLFDVPAEAFNPPPKVVSGVILLQRRSQPLTVASERRLQVLVKTAFGQRRKTLRNATKSLFDAATLADDIFNKRAEQLSLEQFAELTFKML